MTANLLTLSVPQTKFLLLDSDSNLPKLTTAHSAYACICLQRTPYIFVPNFIFFSNPAIPTCVNYDIYIQYYLPYLDSIVYVKT